MVKQTKLLPQATRRHLFDLVTDAAYRRAADSANYDYVPDGDGKMARKKGRDESLVKYGYNANLASGTATRNGGPDPGRYRLAAFTNKVAGGAQNLMVARTTWWVAEHMPANTYKFHKIVIPACKTCHGEADEICKTCGGSGHVAASIESLSGPCNKCGSKGFAKCKTCDPPVIVDGACVSRKIADWS